MNRTLTGLVLALMSSGALAANAPAKAPPTTSAAAAAAAQSPNEPALDENYFLKAAQDSATSGDRDAAVQLWQSAIIYAPSDPVPYQRLAQFYAGTGESELAKQYYGLALQARPTYAPALQGLAMLDLANGDRAGAMAQRDILRNACGANCPETAQVEKALNDPAAVLDRSGSAQ